eukprot:TRINITY_DN44214_c0_g1_i3.p1 TRINITY_DN44214_c0_g1~~TRINITY_DN44214_c0_g1_i3.p1  ORF type:complete len:305 (-),score=29.65 TRINITY_DN44214_c0_g1_i3:50-964(-)
MPGLFATVPPLVLAGAAVVTLLLCCISVGAGIGGGALYMPLYIWLTGDAHTAVPLSKVTTNGVAVAAFVFNVRQNHPKTGGPLIDYAVALILEPLTLIGTVVGVILNSYSTTREIVIALILVLAPTAVTTLQKGLQQRRNDAVSSARAPISDSKPPALTVTEIELQERSTASADNAAHDKAPNTEPLNAASADCERAEAQASEEQASAPSTSLQMGLMAVNWAGHGALLVLAGGPEAIVCGNELQRAVIVLLVVWHIFFTFAWRRFMLLMQEQSNTKGDALQSRGYQVDERTKSSIGLRPVDFS